MGPQHGPGGPMGPPRPPGMGPGHHMPPELAGLPPELLAAMGPMAGMMGGMPDFAGEKGHMLF